MKIVRQGKLPEESLWRGTCTHCSTTVEFKQSEGEYISDQRDGDTVTVKCPMCGRNIYGSKVPG